MRYYTHKIPFRATPAQEEYVRAFYRLGPKELAARLSPLTYHQIVYILRRAGLQVKRQPRRTAKYKTS